MKNRKTNLRDYKKIIDKIPEHMGIKRELKSVHYELSKTIKESKREHSNKEYYKPKIDHLFGVLRRVL